MNRELGYDNDISVSDGVKHIKVKGKEVVQDLLIQIGTEVIIKITKEVKTNIIDSDEEAERVEVPR